MYLKKIILPILLLFFCINAFAKETLVFTVDLVRHGDKTSQLTIPKLPHHWVEGPGQLTARGMQQAFQLGGFFRKKYIYEYHLLPEHYQNGTMLVISTECDRTFMSAQAILLGLYPLGTGPLLPGLGKPALPGAYQPIPVYARPIENKNPILTEADRKQYLQLVKKHVEIGTDWKEKTNKLKNKFQRWNLATGLDFINIRQYGSLAETLYIHKLHHIAMPPGLSKEDIEEIIALGYWGRVTEYQTKEIADFFGKKMLINIVEYLQKASQQATPLKYVLFSDHDTTIGSVMTILQKPIYESPPYASVLNFALFEIGAKNYIVKISYNGKPVAIPGCDTGGCTLKQFTKLARYT